MLDHQEALFLYTTTGITLDSRRRQLWGSRRWRKHKNTDEDRTPGEEERSAGWVPMRTAVSKTRNNHYVAQWYQEGFFEPGRNTLRYWTCTPTSVSSLTADDHPNAKFDAPTSRAFVEKELYSTFFGTSVNDEIERNFSATLIPGQVPSGPTSAATWVSGTTISALFEYIDIQKIRTPKGLDWPRAQYPSLTQDS